MQDHVDGEISIQVELIRGCTCEARGFAIRHSVKCEAFESELTADQVRVLAYGFIALYDAYWAQGRRRHRLTHEKRPAIRQAIQCAGALLGTDHRRGVWPPA